MSVSSKVICARHVYTRGESQRTRVQSYTSGSFQEVFSFRMIGSR